MFDHVGIRAGDGAASERFYDTVLATLGIRKDHTDEQLTEWGDFALSPATDDRPVTRGLHVGFRAPSRDEVEDFWRAGTGAGYRDDGAPGPRPEYTEDYYGSFLLDHRGRVPPSADRGGLPGGRRVRARPRRQQRRGRVAQPLGEPRHDPPRVHVRQRLDRDHRVHA